MQRLKSHLEKLGIVDFGKTIDRFKIYQEFLHEYNSHTNLTSIKDLEEIETRHFIDSLAVLECANNSQCTIKDNNNCEFFIQNCSLLDVGCGAGFPSIPIAIILDALNISYSLTLVDSVKKKTDFLEKLIEKLSLGNITIIHSRVEDLSYLKNSFDIVLNRAVASLPTLLEYSLPFLKLGGHLIAHKGKNAEEELTVSKNALSELGGKFIQSIPYTLGDIEFKLLIIKKDLQTPEKYPRGQNKPRLRPL
ncbi:MAG: 16S rRNA (guanine(527)-N(7))-methyltransferase RsmG [Firmicutes bacterium]|nr:16S rRNA (guanine(527)-N(7))-methyltransferase RsmG [Bacillota bacterium]